MSSDNTWSKKAAAAETNMYGSAPELGEIHINKDRIESPSRQQGMSLLPFYKETRQNSKIKVCYGMSSSVLYWIQRVKIIKSSGKYNLLKHIFILTVLVKPHLLNWVRIYSRQLPLCLWLAVCLCMASLFVSCVCSSITSPKTHISCALTQAHTHTKGKKTDCVH